MCSTKLVFGGQTPWGVEPGPCIEPAAPLREALPPRHPGPCDRHFSIGRHHVGEARGMTPASVGKDIPVTHLSRLSVRLGLDCSICLSFRGDSPHDWLPCTVLILTVWNVHSSRQHPKAPSFVGCSVAPIPTSVLKLPPNGPDSCQLVCGPQCHAPQWCLLLVPLHPLSMRLPPVPLPAFVSSASNSPLLVPCHRFVFLHPTPSWAALTFCERMLSGLCVQRVKKLG